MSSPRERQLAEGIKNKLLSIQKSEQIFRTLSKWKIKIVRMNHKEIQKVANTIASRVEVYAMSVEKRTKKQPAPKAIINRIKKELEEI